MSFGRDLKLGMTRRLGDLLTSAFCKGSVWNGGVLYDDSPPKKVIYDAQPADQNLWSCSKLEGAVAIRRLQFQVMLPF